MMGSGKENNDGFNGSGKGQRNLGKDKIFKQCVTTNEKI